jgi:SAV_6107-like HEPN
VSPVTRGRGFAPELSVSRDMIGLDDTHPMREPDLQPHHHHERVPHLTAHDGPHGEPGGEFHRPAHDEPHRRSTEMTSATLTPALIPAPRQAPRPVAAPTPRAALALLRQAAEGLAEAHRRPEPLMRYPAAYLAALRAGAAVLALRARPAPKRRGSRSVWSLLGDVAPELGEWAAYFASCSATRAAAEAGIERLVSTRDADDLLRQSEQFLELVTELVVGR